jgi:putative chitinase
LFRISLRYHVSMAAIAAANGITNFNLIYAGQRLIIPAAGTIVTTSNAVNTNPVVSTSSILSATTAGAAVVVPPTAIPTQPEYVFTWGGC